ncbi:MAG TPA: methyl-accepting chemotaxis protein, partial [Spirochaetota bacterium]|nr:methyl-accepting chemotaxis protein [Spirochaetota bacterium]
MKWFSNLKVAYKVLLSCLIFILLISFIAFQGIVSIRSAASGFQEFYTDRYIPTRQLNRILRDLLQIRVNMLQEFEAARVNDWKTVEERVKSTADLAQKYMEEWKAFSASKMTEEEKKMADEWVVLAEAPREARGKFRTTVESRNLDQSKVYLAQWLDGFQKLRDKTDELINLQQREADKLRVGMEATARNVVVLSFVFLGLAIFVGVIITFVLARAISGPVRKGLAFAEKLAGGDFTSRIDLDQNDELGMLGKALNAAA